MSVFIFLGPTLSVEEARTELDAVYLPPASQGDVYRAARRRPAAIGIVDGYFGCVPSVWHKEILWAMHEGVHVYGSASMGALRAAELHAFGMVGVGKIFEAFRDGVLEDDDEVAVVHGPAEAAYRPVSEAMVNIRSSLQAAWRAGAIDAKTAHVLEDLAKARFYPERTYANLLREAAERGVPIEQLEALQVWLPGGRVDHKRLDALAMLRLMRSHLSVGLARKQVPYHFEYTYHWDQCWRRAESFASDAVSAAEAPRLDAVLEELCLLDDGWKRAWAGALTRLLAAREARSQGITATPRAVENMAAAYRVAQGLHDPAELAGWLARNGLSQDDFLDLLEGELRIRWVERVFESDALAMLPDHLRSTGEYEALLARARDKHRVLETDGFGPDRSTAADLAGHELLQWYFIERLNLPMPDDVDARAKDLGFPDLGALQQALLRERRYVRLRKSDMGRAVDQDGDGTAPEPGDPAPSFTLGGPGVEKLDLDDLRGRPTVLLFGDFSARPSVVNSLANIAREHQIQIVCIVPRARPGQSATDPSIVVLLDPEGVVRRRYAVERTGTVLLDAGHRLVARLAADDGDHVARSVAAALPRLRCEEGSAQAPALVIPAVLERDICRELMQQWHREGNRPFSTSRDPSAPLSRISSVPVTRRRDHRLEPGPLEARVRERIVRRAYPELTRAFHFHVRGFEQFVICCYVPGAEPSFSAHRDNSRPATAHRRYSMSINLNAGEYSGGLLSFPEYGQQTYATSAGSALVFSSSLVHEVTPLQAGARFAAVTHLWGDPAAL